MSTSIFSAANEIHFALTGAKRGAYEGLDGVFEGIWTALEDYPEWTVLILDEIDHVRYDTNYDPNEFFYRAETDRELVALLYVLYHSYRRFVTETRGVEIDTWLRLHPNGPAVFAAVGDLLDDPWQMRLAKAHVIELFEEMIRTGEIMDVDPAEALEWLVEQRYARLVESRERMIAQVS